MNYRTNIKPTILALSAILAILCLAQVVQAERLRLQRVSKSRQAQSEAPVEPRVTQYQGELRYQRGSGLEVNGVSIRLTRATGIYPLPEDGFLEPSELNGRKAFVYGEDTGSGVRATLVILRPERPLGASRTQDPHVLPSGSNEDVGSYRAGSPR